MKYCDHSNPFSIKSLKKALNHSTVIYINISKALECWVLSENLILSWSLLHKPTLKLFHKQKCIFGLQNISTHTMIRTRVFLMELASHKLQVISSEECLENIRPPGKNSFCTQIIVKNIAAKGQITSSLSTKILKQQVVEFYCCTILLPDCNELKKCCDFGWDHNIYEWLQTYILAYI